jgi:hypothetical protein
MVNVPKTAIPPTLYKYYPPERVDIIESLQIRFSAPGEFNDTFDTRHQLSTISEANSSSAQAVVAKAKSQLDQARFRNSLGVLCLTASPDNHLMWVNYARNHTGFVVGFRTDATFFEVDGRTLRQVVYQSSPPFFDTTSEESACFYKSLDWGYEQEWRCVRRFSRGEGRLLEIEENLITEVILGHHMEPWNVARLAWYIGLRNMAPAYFQSSPDHSHWKLLNEPKTVTPCEHCSGQGFRMGKLP